MGEKLDLFELSVKRGLEHHEMPLDKSAWNAFQGNLTGAQGAPLVGGASSFLSKFGLAAAVLAGAVLFINHSSKEEVSAVAHANSAQHSKQYDGQGMDVNNAEADRMTDALAINEAAINAAEISAQEIAKVAAEAAAIENRNAVTQTESNRIARINDKLQHASKANLEVSSDKLEKRLTTRYVGTAFNLGAVKSFTPNNDGHGDYFLPNKIEDNDIFILKITGSDGNHIFESTSAERPWVGLDTLGNEVPEGRYAWEVILQGDSSVNKEIFRGTVRLER